MENNREYIGLFGGTFNPVHNAHLHVAKEVKTAFGLGKIWLIPSATPPHKKSNNVADARHRLEMLRLATENDSDFSISDVELKRSGPSYSIDTVRHFQSILPENTRIFFIVGLDAFLEIHTWKSYQKLFDEIPFIVISRPFDENDGKTKLKMYMWEHVGKLLSRKVCQGYRFEPEKQAYVHEEKKTVYLLKVTPIDISATKIRNLVSRNGSIEKLVPEKVKDYIERQRLYK